MSAISTVTTSQTFVAPPQTSPPTKAVETERDREVSREAAPPRQSGRVLNLVA